MAATGVFAKLFAQSRSSAITALPSRAVGDGSKFEFRHDSRAVARRDVA
jgi:hypothetical protein